MTIKTLIFALILYICLVWVGAAYLRPDEVQHYGLLWTAIGLIAVLFFIVAARVFGWWRLWRARAAARPKTAKPAEIVNEDDAAMAALMTEANTTLASAPAYAARRKPPLAGMPLYLLIGPEGSGKTSVMVNSGLEPQLLAGQVAGAAPIVPTRLCNLWLANDAVFAEISGHIFSGEAGRWAQVLKTLRGQPATPLWKRLWKGPEAGMLLRGVVAFSNAKAFTGTQNVEGLDRRSRELQERLRAVGEVFGTEFPVYQVITNCDTIPFFADFFRRLPEPEANQVLGCTLPLDPPGTRPMPADERAKVLTRSVRPLYHELAKERIRRLAHEPDPAKRPAIYEFPRELKRIRTPLVQFLNDTFRPNPLRPGPLLRGYYFTGTREVETAVAPSMTETRVDMSLLRGGMGGDATRIFRSGETSVLFKPGARSAMGSQWVFVADLFRKVILADQPVQKASPVDARLERYRRAILATATGLCLLLCVGWIWSWGANRALLGGVRDAAEAANASRGAGLTRSDLVSLDGFREKVQQLIDWDRGHRPWGVRWGLYSGNRVLYAARAAYFRRFQELLLNKLNGEMVAGMKVVPVPAPDTASSEPVYSLAKTHLMLSSDTCKAEPAFASGVLKQTRQQAGLAAKEDEAVLADRQIDFYTSELLTLGRGFWVNQSSDAVEHARQYLQSIKSTDAIYTQLKAQAEKAGKVQHLADLSPGYKSVLTGPPEPSAAFSPAGWKYVQEHSKEGINVSEDCVMGSSALSQVKQEAAASKQIQSRFIQDYIAQWRTYVDGFAVIKYASPADASRRLGIMSEYNSPVLGVLAVASRQTNFPSSVVAPSGLEQGIQKLPFVARVFSGGKRAEKAVEKAAGTAAGGMGSTSDIVRAFQPVQWVVPPASEKLIGENNTAYVTALGKLGHAMQALAGNQYDAQAQQAANQSYDEAMAAAQQVERGFALEALLDFSVHSLLEQPITHARAFIIKDVPEAQANGELRKLCLQLNPVLRKYPFQQSSQQDVTLDELTKLFSPASGAIWTFQKASLAESTVKDGSQWKAKDAAPKPVTGEMLAFLNRAQAIADAFFGGGGTQPQLVYTLRPNLDSSWGKAVLQWEADGQEHTWASIVQHQFTWPAPAGKDSGAKATIYPGIGGFPFASEGGIWGIFRVMGDAEPRALETKVVQWKYMRGDRGRKEEIRPGPISMAIVGSNPDIFNPRFFMGLQCPAKALQ